MLFFTEHIGNETNASSTNSEQTPNFPSADTGTNDGKTEDPAEAAAAATSQETGNCDVPNSDTSTQAKAEVTESTDVEFSSVQPENSTSESAEDKPVDPETKDANDVGDADESTPRENSPKEKHDVKVEDEQQEEEASDQKSVDSVLQLDKIPPDNQRGWWRITSQATIRQILLNLNGRGIRERNLQKQFHKSLNDSKELLRVMCNKSGMLMN